MTLANRSVLITGATSGVGRALAIAWAERGAHVLVHGRDARRLTEVSEAVGGTPLSVDLAAPDGPSRLANAAQEATPPVSALINNAAIQLNYFFTEEPSAEAAQAIDREVTVDLTVPLQTTALLLPTLREAANQSGAPSLIVNVTSGLALAPKKTAAVYCAAKAGLRTFSKALRYQMKDAMQADTPTIRVVEVMLPLVDTPMTAGRDTRVGKMDPESVAEEILSGLSRGSEELYVGKASAFRLLHRWAPRWAERLLRNG